MSFSFEVLGNKIKILVDTSLLCLFPGWGTVTAVAALSRFPLLRVQQHFCKLNPSQETSKEDRSHHTRWGRLHFHPYMCLFLWALNLVLPCIWRNCIFLSFTFRHPSRLDAHPSQATSASEETNSDWPNSFHPAKTTDNSCALSSRSSSPTGQDDNHPAPADHCAACG